MDIGGHYSGRIDQLPARRDRLREFFGIGLRIEPAMSVDILEAMNIQKEFGLFVNDALLLAIARRTNCNAIATMNEKLTNVGGFIFFTEK